MKKFLFALLMVAFVAVLFIPPTIQSKPLPKKVGMLPEPPPPPPPPPGPGDPGYPR